MPLCRVVGGSGRDTRSAVAPVQPTLSSGCRRVAGCRGTTGKATISLTMVKLRSVL